MSIKKRILLKLTGEIFLAPQGCKLSIIAIKKIIAQIEQLQDKYQFGIVIGGGNFFRGNEQGKQLGLSAWCADQIGMLATMMNGLLINDLFDQTAIPSQVFNAIPCQGVGMPVSHEAVHENLKSGKMLVFIGGTGNPFFTTDTNAVLRALQIGTDEIWKGTNVDGIYTADPRKDPSAVYIKDLTYEQALDKKIDIMEATAFMMASVHKLIIRVFNIWTDNALVQVAGNKDFGSTIHS